MIQWYFPPLVKERIMSYFPPVPSEARKVWDALKKFYIQKSREGEYRPGQKRPRISIVSFRNKRLKTGRRSLFKYACTSFPFSRKRGQAASLEVERYWFLLKGFVETDRYWEYWEEYTPKEYRLSLQIRKGILHAIHSNQSWYWETKSNKKRYYRDCRRRRRVTYTRWNYRNVHLYPYNRNRGDFVPDSLWNTVEI